MAGNDWYSVLGVVPHATTNEIAQAVEKRSRQAAALANTAPERSQQLREQIREIKSDLLSGDQARAAYDGRLAAAAPRPMPASEQDGYQQHSLASGYPQAGHLNSREPQGNADWAAQPRRANRFLKFLQSGWTCPSCGESAMPGDKFCTQCSAQLGSDGSYTPATAPVVNPNACPYCGTVAAVAHRFCRSCGAGRG